MIPCREKVFDHCSEPYVRMFTKENMLEMLHIHLQDIRELKQECEQDIVDIEQLIHQIEGRGSNPKDGKPLC